MCKGSLANKQEAAPATPEGLALENGSCGERWEPAERWLLGEGGGAITKQ